MTALDRSLIRQIATECRLQPDLLEAQIIVESNGDRFAFRFEERYFDTYIRSNPMARGYKYGPIAACSFGLLQIVLETALEDGFTGLPHDLFISRVGLLWGARHLSALLHGWADEDYDRALAAYNGGKLGNASRPFRNQDYVDRVRLELT